MLDTPAELLAKLDYPEHKPRFPRAALREIIERKDEMTPHLLAIVDECVADPRPFLDGPRRMLPTYAAFLLAQFQETRAYRPLLALLSLPGEAPDELFGDSITGDISRVLASVFDGDEGPLRTLIENPAGDDYARGCAGLGTYLCLLHQERITIGEVEAYFRELLEHRLEREPSMVWNELALNSGLLGFSGLLPLIRQAYKEDLCDPGYIGLEEVEHDLKHGGREDWRENCTSIDDVMDEMNWWACFSESGSKRPPIPHRNLPQPTGKPVLPPPSPYAGVGRNDPCPCGSGKKFKKCHGA
ncbi:MAG: DUF1186 domain-containing protein [Akkermansiaceae bacterium]|nr:DUF1186 domain-containing protein [Akkermansiaceae bacterium]